MALRIVDKLVYFHSSIGGDVERRAICKGNAEPTIRSGLDHVATIDEVTNFRMTDAVRRQLRLNNDGGGMFNQGSATITASTFARSSLRAK